MVRWAFGSVKFSNLLITGRGGGEGGGARGGGAAQKRRMVEDEESAQAKVTEMDSCFVNGLFLFFLHSLPDIVKTSTLPTIPCPLLLFFKSCKQFKFVYQRLSWYFNLQSGRFK